METNNFLKSLIITGLFAVLLIPLIVSTSLFFPFITGKAFFFRVVVEIVFCAWVLLAIRDRNYLPKKSWISILMLLFIGIVGIADIFGVNPAKSIWSNYERMEGWVTITHVAAYFFVAASVLNERLWMRYFKTSISVSTLLCVYGLFQLAGRIAINQGGLRLDATLGNAIYFAGFLLVNIFFTVFLLVREKSKNVRYVYVALILIHTIILYYTATRGAVLGLVGGLSLSSCIILIWGKGWSGYRKAALGVVGGVLLLVLLFFAFRNTDFVRKDPVLSRFASISWSETKTHARGFIWPMAIKGFKERPILGWGQENFNIVFNKHYNPLMDQEQWFDRTHNIILDWLIAAGILGALSYLSLFVAVLVLIWRRGTFTFVEKSILTGLFAAYFFHNMFVFDNLVSYLFFAAFLAYVHHNSKPTEIKSFEKLESNDYLQKIAPGIVAVIIVVLLWGGNWKPYVANRTLLKAIQPQQASIESNKALFQKALAYETFGTQEIREQLFQRAIQIGQFVGQESAKREFLTFAKEELDKQIAAAPNDARAYYFQGSFLAAFGLYKEAIPYLEKGREFSPEKQIILFTLGESYLNSGQGKKALEVLRYTYELDKTNFKAMKVYGLTALYEREPFADELINNAYTPKHIPGVYRLEYDTDLARAYFNIGRYARAIEIWNVVIANEPNNVNNYIDLANAYIHIANSAKALETLNKAVAVNPGAKGQIDPLIQKVQAAK